jgi:hypothetical protein
LTQERKEEMRENEYKNKNEENNQPRENEENSRSKEYTRLLKRYVKNTKKSLKLKLILKRNFFIGISSIFVILIISFVVVVIVSALNYGKLSSKNNVALILPLVSSLSTTLVAICKLPEIIAHYLFNPEEERSIIDIIGKMQEYDIQMVKPNDEILKMSKVCKKMFPLDDSMKDSNTIGSDVNETFEKIRTIKMPSKVSSNKKNKSSNHSK